MKKMQFWQFALVSVVVAMILSVYSCSNDDIEVVEPSSAMESEVVFQTVYGTDALKTPFVCNDNFLFLQWYFSSTYTYLSSVDGNRDTLSVDPMACVYIKIEDGTSFSNDLADLTNVRELSFEKFQENGFVWYEKVLSVGPKIISLKWGSDVDVTLSTGQQNIVFPYLKFTEPQAYSCNVSATNEINNEGKRIYRVDFETAQDMCSVESAQKISEREVYRFHWFVSL